MRTVTELVKVTLAQKSGPVAETITTTSEHPFFVQGKGFVPAGRLAVGNAIVTRAGPDLVVQSIQQENHPDGVRVYNLEVEGDHTYFVGSTNGGAWVHNTCPFDIRFSQDSIGRVFSHGPWAGRTLDEAIAEANRLGRLPDGLSIDVMDVNNDLVTLNNRSLYVAQQANLSDVPTNDVGPGGWNRLWKQMRDLGGPLPFDEQPSVR